MKILKIITLTVLLLLISVFAVRIIGIAVNRTAARGGINESLYADINGDRQWLSIYGKSKDNPVMLYLHGGPGASTSDFDYKIVRKFSDTYTVVTWDQRGCGKSYNENTPTTKLTKELLMTDGKEVTEFILDYLSVEKITVMGHSWGSIFGANLVLQYPEYYDCFIGVGQLIDVIENEIAFKAEAYNWVKDDEDLQLINSLTPEAPTAEHFGIKNKLMKKHGYHLLSGGRDYNLFTTQFFNPYYSVFDYFKLSKNDSTVYEDFTVSEEFLSFSLKGRYDYEVPYFNINGDKDFQTNYRLANDYFDAVNAPYKKAFLMKDMTHGLLESRSGEFSEIIHQIHAILRNQ